MIKLKELLNEIEEACWDSYKQVGMKPKGGRMVPNCVKKEGLEENTIVVYASDQGFFLGEHGWFDKRFMYEEALRTPLMIKYPKVR